VLHFVRCDLLTAGLPPAGGRPCWAHKVKNHVRRTWFCFMPPIGGRTQRPFREGPLRGSNCNCSWCCSSFS
jgi:hypothetical protein